MRGTAPRGGEAWRQQTTDSREENIYGRASLYVRRHVSAPLDAIIEEEVCFGLKDVLDLDGPDECVGTVPPDAGVLVLRLLGGLSAIGIVAIGGLSGSDGDRGGRDG
jgi:hypothetical protein